MSHVDEGALHAYLDGALDEYPAGEARRIRGHLETCAVCAERLVEERRVREEARTILGLASPDVEAPTFEELRAHVRASQPTPSPASLRLRRLGWAASVAVALGTGWMLRGGRVAQLTRAASEVASDAPGTSDYPEARDSDATVTGRIAEAAAQPADDGISTPEPTRILGDATPPRRVGPSSAAAPEAVASDRVASARTRDDVLPMASDAASSDNGAERAATVPSPALDGTGAAELPAAAMPPAPVPLTLPPAPVSLQENVAERQRAASPNASERQAETDRRSPQGQVLTSALSAEPTLEPDARNRSSDVEEPSEDDTGSLIVPGLDLIAVLPVSEGRTFAGMRALQRLENGDTLEVVHLAEGVAPSTLSPVHTGNREIVLERGAGWIVLRAPRTEAELLALLQRLEAGN